jgi:hypothetical protein
VIKASITVCGDQSNNSRVLQILQGIRFHQAHRLSSRGGSRRFIGRRALHIEKRALFSLPKLIEDPGDKC